MVTQHEVDYLAREVADLSKRMMRTEGDVLALRAEVARLGVLALADEARIKAVEAWRGGLRDATVSYPAPTEPAE
jgi:hypothetical protein